MRGYYNTGMKEITKIFKNNIKYDLSKIGNPEKVLFFDIETTGLSPKNSKLYLIGCISVEKDNLNFKQWFSENMSDETAMLQSFYEYAAKFDTLIHFNGDGFDLPYIRECAGQYYLFNPLDDYVSIDIYKKIRHLKKPLGLERMNQKSLEEFLGLHREDIYTGGELIEFYYRYTQNKDSDILHALLLHNEEDLLGMLKVVEMLSYPDFFDSNFTVKSGHVNNDTLFLNYICNETLPHDLKLTDDVSLYISGNKAEISIPILKDELKFFFENYKDYYYLTIEDYAIHKSIGEFVDKAVKKKATRQTAYIRQFADYIYCFNMSDIDETFKKDYKSKEKYINLARIDFDDKEFFGKYLVEIFKHFKLLK